MIGLRTANRIGIALLVAAFLVVSTLAQSEAQKPVKIRVAYITGSQLITMALLKPEVLKNLNKTYTIELIRTRGSSSNIQLFANNSIDFGYMAAGSFARAVLNAKASVKVVWSDFVDGEPGYFSVAYAALASSPIKKVEDLRGKNLGILGHGTATHMALKIVLRKHGLEEGRDYNVVEGRLPSQGALLRDRKIDLGVFASSFWGRENRKAKMRTIFSTVDAVGTSEYLFYAGRTDFWEKHPKVMQDFMDDYVRGMRWVLNPKNRDELITRRAKWSKRPPSSIQNWALLRGKDYYRQPDGLVDVKRLQKDMDMLAEQKFIPKKFDVSKHVDLSHIKNAVRRVGR